MKPFDHISIRDWKLGASNGELCKETGLFSSPSTWVHKHIQMWVKYKCETSSKWDECLFAIKVVYMCSGIWIRNVVKNYLLFVWLVVTACFCSTDMDGHKSGKSFDVHQSLANLLFYAISLSACSLTGWMRGVEPVSSPCFTANLICQHQICCTMLKMQYTLHHGEVHP